MASETYTKEHLEVLLALAKWGDQFPETPMREMWGVAKIEVTFPSVGLRVELLEDMIKVHDLAETEAKENK